MVDQLSSFADEVTRVAREVGTDGMLGGQARVPGVAGTWRDLTDSVNSMASNLTNQVRSIAIVSTAVARGDLSQKIAIEARGEVAALAVDDQRDGRHPASVRRRGHPCGPRGRHRGHPRRPGARPRRGRHLEGPHRLGELDGGQPDQPGAQHRAGHHRRRARRPHPEDVRRRARRDPRAEDHRQPDGRPAVVVRRRGHPCGPRGRHRGQARRPGRGGRRLRHLAQADRERQPAGRHADHPAPRDRRGVDRGDPGRPEPADHGRGPGRGRRAQGQPEPDDRQPARDHAGQPGAGLAEDQPGPVHRPHAGRPRPARRHQPDRQRADPAGRRDPGLVLPHRDRRRRVDAVAAPDRVVRLPQAGRRARRVRLRRGPGRPGRRGPADRAGHRRAARATCGSPPGSARPRRCRS